MIVDDNNLLIEETRKKIERERKKTVRYNLLMSLLFFFIIIGLGGAIYYYNQLKKLNIKVSNAETALTIKNDSLRDLTKALEVANNRLAAQKKGLENVIDSASRSENPATILKAVGNNRDSARIYARIGYNKLKQKDFAGAREAFEKSEAKYNGYHDSYEVGLLLRKNKDKLNDPVVQRQLLEKIYKEYNSLQIIKRTDIN